MKDDKLSNAISIFFYCFKMVSSLKIKKTKNIQIKIFNYSHIKQK